MHYTLNLNTRPGHKENWEDVADSIQPTPSTKSAASWQWGKIPYLVVLDNKQILSFAKGMKVCLFQEGSPSWESGGKITIFISHKSESISSHLYNMQRFPLPTDERLALWRAFRSLLYLHPTSLCVHLQSHGLAVAVPSPRHTCDTHTHPSCQAVPGSIFLAVPAIGIPFLL